MYDINLAAKWIYQRLASDPIIAGIVGARIYRDVAPQGSILPAIIYQIQSGEDFNGAGAVRIYSTLTVVIKAVGQNASYAGDLAALAGRIDELIHGRESRVDDAGYVWAHRQRPFNLAENADGVQYRHLGGVYRVVVQVYS